MRWYTADYDFLQNSFSFEVIGFKIQFGNKLRNKAVY
jgi:hypothetical protein